MRCLCSQMICVCAQIRIREALDIVHTILASSSGHTERDDPSDASFSYPATITASISEGQKAWVRGCYSA